LLATGKELASFRAYKDGGIFVPATSPTGGVVAVSSWVRESPWGWPKPVVHLWEIASRSERRMIPCAPRSIGSHPSLYAKAPVGWPAVSFSPNGQHLALACYDTIGLLDINQAREVRCFEAAELASGPAAFSPDGKILAAGSGDGRIHLWDVATGTVRRRVAAHDGAVAALAFGPDGRTLASAGRDSAALVWDVAALLREEPRR
jgi:WD40 repeat protein